MRRDLSCAVVSVCAAISLSFAASRTPAQRSTPSNQLPAQPQQQAFWIWTGSEARIGEKVFFRQRLRLSEKPTLARLVAEGRGPFSVFVNGAFIKRFPAGAHTLFISKYLAKGQGVLAFDASAAESSGIRFELSLRYPDGRMVTVYSNGDEAVSRDAPIGWQTTALDDARWPRATVIPGSGETTPPRTSQPTQPQPQPVRTEPLPVSRPDTTRLVRLWDIRGSRRPAENPYAGARAAGERMLLSAGMAPDADLPLLASTGFTLLESSTEALSTPETEPGVWDLSLLDADRARVRRAGFDWSFFPHFAFPPELRGRRRSFTEVRCLEHDSTVSAFSPWDPAFLTYVDAGLSAMARAFEGADGAAALDLGIHGDYGEAGYLSGARMSVPQLRDDWVRRFGDPHNHPGWWCGDSIARSAFRGAMIAKYRTVDAINRAWQTEFRSAGDIGFPTSPSDGSRRRWLDFVHWYRDSATRMAEGIAEAAMRRFPNRLYTLPLGFPDEDPRGGNDISALVKMAGRLGLSVRSTHGGYRGFAENQASMMGRIASAARFYEAPLWNEATGKLSVEEETARLFSSISQGGRGLFDWPDNIRVSRDVYYRYGKHLRVETPIIDVAMFFPTSSHLLRQEGYPQVLAKGCTDLRDVLNYDIVDEQMTLDGALNRYRLLVLWEGIVVEGPVLAKIREWVERGGVLVAYDFGKIETPEGDRTWFADVFGFAGRMRTLPAPVAGEAEDVIDVDKLRDEWARPLGRGWTVYYPARRTRLRSYYEVVRFLTYHLSDLDSSKRNALAVDDAWDGMYATLLADKVVYYNPGRAAVSRTVSLPAAAVAAQPDLRVRPTFTSYSVNVEPNGIGVLPFVPAPQEMLYQCEAFRTLGPMKPLTGETFHPGQGSTHVLIPKGRAISTRIRIEAPGSYTVYYRTTRSGALTKAELILDGKTLKGSSKGPSAWGQTLTAGTMRLNAGVYTLTVRPPAGEAVRADFVVLSADPSVAGYAFAEK